MGNITDGDSVALALQAGWLLISLMTALVGAVVWLESWRTWQAVVRRKVTNGRRTLALMAFQADSAILLLLSVITTNGLLAISAKVWGWPGQWGADYIRPGLLVVALMVTLCSRVQVMYGRRRLQRDGLERFDLDVDGASDGETPPRQWDA